MQHNLKCIAQDECGLKFIKNNEEAPSFICASNIQVIQTYRILLVLVKDFAVAPIHVGHVDGAAIRPEDFPEQKRKIF